MLPLLQLCTWTHTPGAHTHSRVHKHTEEQEENSPKNSQCSHLSGKITGDMSISPELTTNSPKIQQWACTIVTVSQSNISKPTIGGGEQEVQTSRCKIHESCAVWGTVNNSLVSSYGDTVTRLGDHFEMYRNIGSLCCVTGPNIVL